MLIVHDAFVFGSHMCETELQPLMHFVTLFDVCTRHTNTHTNVIITHVVEAHSFCHYMASEYRSLSLLVLLLLFLGVLSKRNQLCATFIGNANTRNTSEG